MSNAHKSLGSFCIPLLFSALFLISCEDPGSVGSDYINKSELVFDTLTITNITPESYSGYSGRMGYVAVGNFDDPAFGEISAVGMFKPAISLNLPASRKLDDSYTFYLDLKIDTSRVYGDSLLENSYNVYQITTPWNGISFKINSEMSYDTGNLVGTFDHAHQASVLVPLSNAWRDVYLSYYETPNADSLLQHEFGGLAIVSNTTSDKIIFPQNSTRFLAIKAIDEPDTVVINIRDWAYTLTRQNEAYPLEMSPLHSTLEAMLSFELSDFFSEIEGRNLIKAELVFYEATDYISNGLSNTQLRPLVNTINIDLDKEADVAYGFQFSPADMIGTKNAADNTFRINVTNYFNNVTYGNEKRMELNMGIGTSLGIVTSTLVYNENAPAALHPKLILTYLEEVQN